MKHLTMLLTLLALTACGPTGPYGGDTPTNNRVIGPLYGGVPPWARKPGAGPDTTLSAWVCTGPVTPCSPSEDPPDDTHGCDYVTGHGDSEKNANADARENCENHLAATTGIDWYCAIGSGDGLTCEKSN